MNKKHPPTSQIVGEHQLLALSPADGRYAQDLSGLRPIFSEYGLIRQRLMVEVMWFKKMAATKDITHLPELSKSSQLFLDRMVRDFSVSDAQRIKAIEKETNHDLKAVEYFLRERFSDHKALKPYTHFLHFACTSWDINNLAYGLMLNRSRTDILLPEFNLLLNALVGTTKKYAAVAMLSRTHGQPASPTTMGKEVANFAWRLHTQVQSFLAIKIDGKANGAVGNYNAHLCAYPSVDWQKISREFVASLDLEFNPYTTQIDPYDSFAEYLHAIVRINNVLLDLCRDMWGYISLAYFDQKIQASHVGSSTMPHKVNPIEFENAEGNLGVANALAEHLATRLCVSRWQRDLSDSTALRSLSVVISHTLLAVKSIVRGLKKLRLNRRNCSQDLDAHYEILGEALQTVMRKHGIEDAYEQIKAMTRGCDLDADRWRTLVKDCNIPTEEKTRLLALTPMDYTGLAEDLARQLEATIKKT